MAPARKSISKKSLKQRQEESIEMTNTTIDMEDEGKASGDTENLIQNNPF
jgi:hypothetical protein